MNKDGTSAATPFIFLLLFALIYLNGFEYMWRPIRKYVHPIIPFAMICIFILYAQVLVTREVFRRSAAST